MTDHPSTRFAHVLADVLESWGAHLAEMLLSPRSQFSIGAIAIVLGIAVAATLSGRRAKRDVRLKVLGRALFPRRLIRSASGRTDIGFFIFNVLPAPLLVGWALFSSAIIEEHARSLLLSTFGARESAALPFSLGMVAMTLAGYLAYEFGYWLDHYLKHRVPFLWAFHKVHHSAESLSPLTNFRVHPIDTIIFYNIAALAIGSTEAFVNFLLGHQTPAFTIWGSNILILAGGILLTHLQHSHIWISFTGWLGRLLLSPAHHQIHHSTNPVHFNRNFGSTLALFDLLFGTLHMPSKRREKLTFGVEGLGYDPHSATGGLLMPLVDAWAEIRRGQKGSLSGAQPQYRTSPEG